jgi:hypothetical protein
MSDIWPSLVPILLADVVNPVLFAFMVYAAGTDRPIANSSALLLGHTVAYFTERSQPMLERVNLFLDKASGIMMPILLILVALALIVDALYYFTTGDKLL